MSSPMTHQLVSEDQLVAMSLGGADLPADVSRCADCAGRHRAMTQVLREVTDATVSAADHAFPPERLSRQRARILQRVEHLGRRARVLTFPEPRRRRPFLHPQPVRRWVAGAAAAGLIVGMVAGHMAHELPGLHQPALVQPAVQEPVPLRASTEVLGDDELLRQVQYEVDAGTVGPAALRRIADMTPVAWDVH
jgi:hypothetical protein